MMEKEIKKKLLVTLGFFALGVILLVTLIFNVIPREERGEENEPPKGENINFLFLGTDREAGLCDVMMLVGFDTAEDSVCILQIPRDTYAAYTESSYKKLNGAYQSLGGAKQTADFLSEAMGIPIHHYVCIDLDTLSEVVDALGGVELDIPFDMKYSDPSQGLYIDLRAGRVLLDGKTAEHFIRYRSGYGRGDLDRLDAQKLFVAAFVKTVARKPSPKAAIEICSSVEGVETDLSASDMLSIGMRALSVKEENAVLLTMPGEEVTATVSGASYFSVSASAASEILFRYFGGDGSFDPKGLFLNSSYDTFAEIYNGYTPYKIYTVDGILAEGKMG